MQVRAVGEHGTPVLLMWGKQDKVVPFTPNFDRWKVENPPPIQPFLDGMRHRC